MSQNNLPNEYQPEPVDEWENRPKNKILTFVCALIPGAGQMYQGRMKQGLLLMSLFWGVILLSVLLYAGALSLTLPIIWFYAFFDAVNRMNTPRRELKAMESRLPWEDVDAPPKRRRLSLPEFFQNRHRWIGAGLILLAVWICLNELFGHSYGYYSWQHLIQQEVYYAIYSAVLRTLPTLLLPLLCIVLGVRLIAGPRKRKPKTYDEYTIPDPAGDPADAPDRKEEHHG